VIQTVIANNLNSANLMNPSWSVLLPQDVASGSGEEPGVYLGTAAWAVNTGLSSYGYTADDSNYFNKSDPSTLQNLVNTYHAVAINMNALDGNGNVMVDGNGNPINHTVAYDGVNMYSNGITTPETPAQMSRLANSTQVLVLVPMPMRN
jgi:hypothetical protein